MDDDKDDPKHISYFLTDIPFGEPFLGDKYPHKSITFDWEQSSPPMHVVGNYQWITAIQKVTPRSSAFWYAYGRKHNEKIVMKISGDRDPQGRRCCDVMVYSKRPTGDVVTSAWNEYLMWVKELGM